MDVRLTSVARDQLLDAIVALRDRDRDAAWSFLRRVTGALVDLGTEPDLGGDVPPDGGLDRGGDGYRFLYRVRDDAVWVLALWTHDDPAA